MSEGQDLSRPAPKSTDDGVVVYFASCKVSESQRASQ